MMNDNLEVNICSTSWSSGASNDNTYIVYLLTYTRTQQMLVKHNTGVYIRIYTCIQILPMHNTGVCVCVCVGVCVHVCV